MTHEESHLTGAGGLRIYWQCWLPDAGARAVVVIAHGAGEHSGRYAHVAARLVSEEGLYHEILNEPEQDRVLDDMCSWLGAHVAVRA